MVIGDWIRGSVLRLILFVYHFFVFAQRIYQLKHPLHQRVIFILCIIENGKIGISKVYSALERLSECRGIIKREIIELLVITVDTDVSAISKLDPTEWDAYLATPVVTR
jgi:hypothetical protein